MLPAARCATRLASAAGTPRQRLPPGGPAAAPHPPVARLLLAVPQHLLGRDAQGDGAIKVGEELLVGCAAVAVVQMVVTHAAKDGEAAGDAQRAGGVRLGEQPRDDEVVQPASEARLGRPPRSAPLNRDVNQHLHIEVAHNKHGRVHR